LLPEQEDIVGGLIEASRAGDKKAQYRLYSMYSKAMYNICTRMLNSREEAEDILQEAFSEAFYRLGSFRQESTFGAWLRRIVVNRCINALKKKKLDVVPLDDQGIQVLSSNIEPDTELYSPERILRALSKLPDGYRIVFSMYILDGYSHKEIAEMLNITESTSKTQYLRAKQRIKELLIKDDHE
jgi:RNA polymerase sigma factor (sigma-70 family)